MHSSSTIPSLVHLLDTSYSYSPHLLFPVWRPAIVSGGTGKCAHSLFSLSWPSFAPP